MIFDALAFIDFNWKKEIFELGPLEIRYYGLMWALSFFLGFLLVKKMFQLDGASEKWLDKGLMYIIVGTIIGARLGHLFFYEPWFDSPDPCDPTGTYMIKGFLSHPETIIMIWKGGLASHGAAIGIIIASWLYAKRVTKLPITWLLDKVVVAVAFAATLIRLGNFFNHEIIGSPSNLPWAVKFNRAGDAIENCVRYSLSDVPRHPVQLYEAMVYLIIFFVLRFLYFNTNARKISGFILGLFMLLVFVARFFLEFFKHHQSEFGAENVLKTGQLLSIPLALAGLVIMILAVRKHKTEWPIVKQN